MDQLKENFLHIQKLAQTKNVGVELLYTESERLSLGYKKRKLDKFESIQSQIAGLRVILGAAQGYAYTENLSKDSLAQAFQEAYNNAEGNAKALDKNAQAIELFKPTAQLKEKVSQFAEIPFEQKKKLAEQLESLCLEKNKIQSVPYNGFSESFGSVRVLNSEGVDQKYTSKGYSAYAYPLAKDGESSKMAGESVMTRDFNTIDVNKIVEKGVEKAVSRLNAQKLKTGNYAAVIDSAEFTMMINMFEDYFSAKTVEEGRSLLEGKLNQKIASPLVTLLDNPLDENLPSYRPFDSEGAPSQKTTLIDRGDLKTFITNLEYSRKMNLPHTAHAARSPAGTMQIGCSNLVIPAGKDSLDSLLKRYPKTVFITELSGSLHAGFNETTGDFSMPAEGFLYENGKLVGPVDQFVFSGNIMDLLQKITGLSDTLNNGSSGRVCPDILVESLSFAGG